MEYSVQSRALKLSLNPWARFSFSGAIILVMNKTIIAGVVFAILLAGVSVYFKSPEVGTPGGVSFETVKLEFYGGIQTPKEEVVKTEAEWVTLWNQMSANVTPKPKVPEINFSKKMVIGVFMGTRSTGGYRTEITKITESADRLTVHVKETSPGQNCAVTMAITNPYHVVSTANSVKQVDFSITKEVTDCT